MEETKEKADALCQIIRLCRNKSWAEDEDFRTRLLETVLGVGPELVNESTELRNELVAACRVLLAAEDWQTAESAAEKLGMLSAREAINDLVAVAINHEDSKVRLTTIEALGKVGANSLSAKEALASLRKDSDISVAKTAKDALLEIESTESSRVVDQSHPFHSGAPPTVVQLAEIYSQGNFISDEHRINYLEACLKFLAGGLAWDEGRGFPWPTTTVFQSNASASKVDKSFEQVGMLSFFGYKVGEEGVVTSERRNILDKLFVERALPQLNSHEYVKEWGLPRTATRLRKMAESLAAFCRNAKRRTSAQMSKSIDDWEADLAWLKAKHYDGKFNFAWPRIGKSR